MFAHCIMFFHKFSCAIFVDVSLHPNRMKHRFCGKKRCAYFSIKMATKTSHGHFQFARLCRKPSVDYRKTKSFGFWWHGWSHRITVILWLNQYFWIQFKNQIICQLNSILLMQNEITLVVASRHFIS